MTRSNGSHVGNRESQNLRHVQNASNKSRGFETLSRYFDVKRRSVCEVHMHLEQATIGQNLEHGWIASTNIQYTFQPKVLILKKKVHQDKMWSFALRYHYKSLFSLSVSYNSNTREKEVNNLITSRADTHSLSPCPFISAASCGMSIDSVFCLEWEFSDCWQRTDLIRSQAILACHSSAVWAGIVWVRAEMGGGGAAGLQV